MQHEKIRAEQFAHARAQRDIEIARGSGSETLKGHEAFLRALEVSQAIVTIKKINGETVVGKLKASDKTTISINTSIGARVLFKHDISEFYSSPRTEGVRSAGV